MPRSFDEFVHLRCIKNFEKQIENETDPTFRQILIRLLAEEKASMPLAVYPKR